MQLNQLTGLGSDEDYIDQQSIQDMNACNYTLQNFYLGDAGMSKAKEMATRQPFVMYNRAGYGMEGGGANVDQNSRLLLGSIQTHPKCRIDLFQRPFVTVPYLGRGSVDASVEYEILQGESSTNRRSQTYLMDKDYMKYHTTPLIPDLDLNTSVFRGKGSSSMQDPRHLLEDSADKNWIRGGIPSRDLTKDTDYQTAHTSFQYV
jgi:hypothetical protein